MSIRVLHILDHSLPVLDGYSHRSRSIIAAQRDSGMRPAVLTGPLHNLDDPAFQEADFDGVHYFRTACRSSVAWRAVRNRWPLLREWAVVHLLQRAIDSLLSRERFDVLHAHSPALCGLAALRSARARRLPFVYEIRSFWEDGTSQSPSSLRYRAARGLETYVAKHTHALVAISRPILQDLASRGVSNSKLFHVPNGVDVSRFVPSPPDATLAAKLGTIGVPTLGFLGTLFPWEGIAWLVEAAAALRARGVRFKLLIIGDGVEAPAVREAIKIHRVEDCVSFLGRVPHEDVERYYSIIEALVYPRKSLRITECVTPLKPLEAMALAKPILASNVGGIRELIDSGKTGLLFAPENIDDFCLNAERLLCDRELRITLGRQARLAVETQRDWKAIAQQYQPAYEEAIRSVSWFHR